MSNELQKAGAPGGPRSGEYTTALVHLYRAEVQRANVWRTRLDTTTNWAVISVGATLTFAFAGPDHHHIVILLTVLLVALFLVIEARRYRYYEVWSSRLRLLESEFYAAMLNPQVAAAPDWAAELAASLRNPRYTISVWEAFGRRFRRNYQYLFTILALAWFIKMMVHPTNLTSWEDFLQRAAIGPIPGPLVLLVGIAFHLLLFGLGWATVGLRQAKGEIL